MDTAVSLERAGSSACGCSSLLPGIPQISLNISPSDSRRWLFGLILVLTGDVFIITGPYWSPAHALGQLPPVSTITTKTDAAAQSQLPKKGRWGPCGALVTPQTPGGDTVPGHSILHPWPCSKRTLVPPLICGCLWTSARCVRR